MGEHADDAIAWEIAHGRMRPPRVKTKRPPPPCPYCGAQARFADSKEIYKVASYGMVWLCGNYPRCDAYVGAHYASGDAKGTLANARLREWRKFAHARFDPLWRDGRMTRGAAYSLFQRLMALSPDQAHIGLLSEAQCLELTEKLKAAGY